MSRLIIRGGNRISGVHRAPGNKNAALPMLTAALLTDETVTLDNLPIIDDVKTTLLQLEQLGVDVALDSAARRVSLRAGSLKRTRLDSTLCAKVRSAILFAGPLLGRCGRATICQPGGDLIGRRRVDTHVNGLRALGAVVTHRNGYAFRSRGLTGTRILLDECSVTATENLVMAAVLARGRTTLYHAACEPHVQNLCHLLNAMGASISGIGTNLLTIDGVERLHGATARIGADFIEAGSYLTAAVVTGGALTIEGIETEDFAVLEGPFRKFGVKWTIQDGILNLPAAQKLRTAYDFGDAIPKIEDGPWPAFPSDLMSILIVLATQTRGTTLFFEKMFESRMYFVDHLISMGARIVQCDPHRVVVTGPAVLHGTCVASPDIRAGIALLIAALAARGETVILNACSIDRGYEEVDVRLRALGAAVERV
jgi:UDP-N-acetylglucosamine 1-carboxyvinyltransferase